MASAPLGVLLVLLTVVTMASGVTTLFYHYFPFVPTTATMTSTCPNSLIFSDPSSVPDGSSGQVTFECSATDPAFTISGGTFSARPSIFYVTAPYTALWIYQSDGGSTSGACSSRTEARQIESGVTLDIESFNYNYCAEYANVGTSGLPRIEVYWYRTPPSGALLFYHLLPAVPTSGQMTTTCANTNLISNPTSVDQGSSGQIAFQCSATDPAFTISGGTFSATPNFDGTGFAAPYTTLWVYQSDGAATSGACSGRTEARQLASGVTQVDMAALSYNYCAEYENVGSTGLPSFYVYWNTT